MFCSVCGPTQPVVTCEPCFRAGVFFLRCPVCRHACGLDQTAAFRAFGPVPPQLAASAAKRQKSSATRSPRLRARKRALGYCLVCPLSRQEPAIQGNLCLPHRAALLARHAKERTPMQWDDTPQAGFSTGTPWININPNFQDINVRQALADPESIFYYYQKLIRLRRENPIMIYGTYDLLLDDHPQIYAFTRTLENDRLLVILNFSKVVSICELPGELAFLGKELLISNSPVNAAQDIRRFELRPYEARVYRLRS